VALFGDQKLQSVDFGARVVQLVAVYRKIVHIVTELHKIETEIVRPLCDSLHTIIFAMLASHTSPGLRSFFDFGVGPLSDILTTKTGYKIELDLPGVKKDDIKIDLNKSSLIVSALRKPTLTEGMKRIHAERDFGTLERSFTLPETAQITGVEATLEDGVLSLVIPKKEEARVQVKWT
jgi:HSP20 family molecular chaperone IbpA